MFASSSRMSFAMVTDIRNPGTTLRAIADEAINEVSEREAVWIIRHEAN